MHMQLHRSATAAATFRNGVWTHLPCCLNRSAPVGQADLLKPGVLGWTAAGGQLERVCIVCQRTQDALAGPARIAGKLGRAAHTQHAPNLSQVSWDHSVLCQPQSFWSHVPTHCGATIGGSNVHRVHCCWWGCGWGWVRSCSSDRNHLGLGDACSRQSQPYC
jgi:hypothetical protein